MGPGSEVQIFHPWGGLGPECLGRNSGFNTYQPVWPWADYPTSLCPGFHLTHHPSPTPYIKDNKSSTSRGCEENITTHTQYLHQSLTQSKCQLLVCNVWMSFIYVHSLPHVANTYRWGQHYPGRRGAGGICWGDKNEHTWPLFLKES